MLLGITGTLDHYLHKQGWLVCSPIKKPIHIVTILSVCQGLALTIVKIGILVGALVSSNMITDPDLFTLPVALIMLGAALVILWIPKTVEVCGVKKTHLIGSTIGILSMLAAAMSTVLKSFLLLCAGFTLLGIYYGFMQFYRFIAADIADTQHKSKAISYVILGGIIASVLGPLLAEWAHSFILFHHAYLGTFLICSSLAVIIFILIKIIDIDLKSHAFKKESFLVTLKNALTNKVFLMASIFGMIAYGEMMLLMTATPLAVVQLFHMSFDTAANILLIHFLGMFLPSVITGRLINQWGSVTVMFSGVIVSFIGIFLLTASQSLLHLSVGIFFIGVGWNFIFIPSSVLVAVSYKNDACGVRLQGMSNFVIFSYTAIAALTSGALLENLGWMGLNVIAGIMMVFLALLLYLFSIMHPNSF